MLSTGGWMGWLMMQITRLALLAIAIGSENSKVSVTPGRLSATSGPSGRKEHVPIAAVVDGNVVGARS